MECGGAFEHATAAGDGAAQVQVEGTVGYRMFGLSNGDPDQGYTSLKYALYPADGGALYVFEAGVNRGQFGTYTAGDLLKVELVSGVVRYYRQAAGSGQRGVDAVVHEHGGAGVSAGAGHDAVQRRGAAAERSVRSGQLSVRQRPVALRLGTGPRAAPRVG